MIADLLHEAATQGFDQVLVRKPDHPADDPGRVGVVALEHQRTVRRDVIRLLNGGQNRAHDLRGIIQVTEEQREIFGFVPVHLCKRHPIVDFSKSSVHIGEEVGKRRRMMLEQELVDAK